MNASRSPIIPDITMTVLELVAQRYPTEFCVAEAIANYKTVLANDEFRLHTMQCDKGHQWSALKFDINDCAACAEINRMKKALEQKLDNTLPELPNDWRLDGLADVCRGWLATIASSINGKTKIIWSSEGIGDRHKTPRAAVLAAIAKIPEVNS